ncbi:MAG: glycosyltransferase N-terminal domain-containing protein [Bacteroidales bacterium]
MKILYSTGISLYGKAVRLASSRNRKAAQMVAGHKIVFDYLKENRKASDRYLWFHAASLGEFEQGRPLIEEIRRSYPHYKIALTFFSPSGYEVRKNYTGADLICYLPFDTPTNVHTFLDLLQPEKAFFIKYEFWANYLKELQKRNIPVYLFSAIFRPEQVFFKWYGNFFRRLLNIYECVFVQDRPSFDLLRNIGIQQVAIAGDTRFDRVGEIRQQAKELPLIGLFRQNAPFVLVAGSSWPKDEDILIDHFNRHPEMKLIIAPHEIHESHIAEIIGKLKRPYVRYSAITEQNAAQAECLIIDCIGLLSSIYRYGEAAYIGGGFGVGIHNVLEAAVYRIPVMFGPNYQKFREARELIALNGATSVENQSQYDQFMDLLLTDKATGERCGKAAGDYVTQNSGATRMILEKVFTTN